MKKLLFGFSLLSLLHQTPILAATEPEVNVIFVVDVSGSMTALLPNIGRSIREQSDGTALKDARMALVSFAGCGKEHVHYLVPLAKNNAEAIKEGTKKLNPYGGTDIIAPLLFTKGLISTLLQEKGECANVILFTDDEDNCNNGKAHIAMLKEIQKMCTDRAKEFKLDVITSTVDDGTRLFLDEIAGATGGKVHDAGTLDEIGEQVKKIAEGYRKKSGGNPLTSKATKPETSVVGDKPAPRVALPQAKKLPAQQGKEEKKTKEGGK